MKDPETIYLEYVDDAWNKMLADSGYTQEKMMNEIDYHTYLEDKFIYDNDCSNQFAYSGTSNCPTNCEHVQMVAAFMVAKFPHLKD